MGRITAFGFLAAAAVVVFAAGTALAANETYRTRQTGAWNDYQGGAVTWEVFRNDIWVPVTTLADLPGAGDTAKILNGHTVTVSDTQSITSLTINSGGQLHIGGVDATDAASLTFSPPGTPLLSITPFDGVVVHDGASLRFSATGTITTGASGSLKGLSSDAAIVLATSQGNDVSLTSSVLIYGALTIKESGSGDGYFNNGYIVRAILPGEAITLDVSLDGVGDFGGLPCEADSRWEVIASGAVLRFNCAATNLNGDFEVGPGRLDVNQPVSTGGGLSLGSGGVITPNVWEGACFCFEEYCGGCTIQSPVCQHKRCSY